MFKSPPFHLVCCLLTACSPFVEHRGAHLEERELKKVTVNVTGQDEVRGLWGSPTTTAAFPDKGGHAAIWYYIYTHTETLSFFAPKVVRQEVVEIRFDRDGIVRALKKHEGENAVQVICDKDKTPTTGYESGLLKDVFGNFGRYGMKQEKGK